MSVNTEALYRIAQALKPAQERIAAFVAAMQSPGLDADKWQALLDTVPEINAMIEPHIDGIAAATPNSAAVLRSAYAPTESADGSGHLFWTHTDFPADFVANVARYQSFNEDYWTSQGWKGWGGDEASKPETPSSRPGLRMR